MERILYTPHTWMPSNLLVDEEQQGGKSMESSSTAYDIAGDRYPPNFVSVVSTDSEGLSRPSTVPFIQHGSSCPVSSCHSGGDCSAAYRFQLHLEDLPEEETITPQQTSRNSSAAIDETGGGCSSGENYSTLLFTPQAPAHIIAMQQSLDGELAMAHAEDTFEPLPSVTPLWNGQLFLGGYPDHETLPKLRSIGVTHIVNCCAGEVSTPKELKEEFVSTELHTVDQQDYRILFHDYHRFSEVLHKILKNPESKVFVHCIAGVNRSVVLCAAFLMDTLHLNPLQALQLFRENGRGRVLENIGFRHQLVDFFFEELQ